MKATPLLRSTAIFALFSLLGPLMHRVSWPTFVGLHREELSILFWPALVLSVGGRANDSHDLWMSLTVNVAIFALLGLIIGALGRRVRAVVLIYICLCGLLTLVEAWGSGFSLAYFSWSVLVIACVLYWLPFWVVISTRSRETRAAPAF